MIDIGQYGHYYLIIFFTISFGEVKAIIFNTNPHEVTIHEGMKVGQAVLTSVVNGKWVELIKVSEIKEKDRNSNGFGSTGI